MKKVLLGLFLTINLFAGIESLEKACNDGDVAMCMKAGIAHNFGQGTDKNYKKAINLYEKACNGGDTKGCYNLGLMHKYGQGVEQNYTKAVEYYVKSCNGGDPWGCRNLGVQYFTGQGVEQNYKKASELYTKSCDAGYTDACGNIGSMYEEGLGVKQNYKKASELYTKSCDGGNALVCSTLALLYLDGLGVKQDETKALELIKKSCDGGVQNACDAYNEYAVALQEESAKTSYIKDKPKFYKENLDGLAFCSASYYIRTITPKEIEFKSKIYGSYGQLAGFITSLYYKKIFNKVSTHGDIRKLKDEPLKNLATEYRNNKTLSPKTLTKIAQCDSLLFYLHNNPQVRSALKNTNHGVLDNESLLFDELAITTKQPIEINTDYVLESFRMWIEEYDGLTASQMNEKFLNSLKKKKK